MGAKARSGRLTTEAGAPLAERCEVARGPLRRGLGLMFRRELPSGEALWLEPCGSIHMFFMRFPLDVAFLDRQRVVVRLYHGIRPWRATRMVRRARTAVELPAGSLAASGVRPGDVLTLEPSAD